MDSDIWDIKCTVIDNYNLPSTSVTEARWVGNQVFRCEWMLSVPDGMSTLTFFYTLLWVAC